MKKSVDKLKFPLKGKYIAMLAPSFVVDFDYPCIVHQLKGLGFEKVVELTFGAKIVNQHYHKILKNNSKGLFISSVCPGIVQMVKEKYPPYFKNLMKVDSPMIATAKICKKVYPRHKIIFISPCHSKKIEANSSDFINYVIDYSELREIIKKCKLKKNFNKIHFDKFYNDYTKIYPLSGGLTKTAHLKGILKKDEFIFIDGIKNVIKFLENPDKKIRFLDVTFCEGGCISGPCVASKLSILKKKKIVLNYMCASKHEDIPETRKGLISQAEGINFDKKF